MQVGVLEEGATFYSQLSYGLASVARPRLQEDWGTHYAS